MRVIFMGCLGSRRAGRPYYSPSCQSLALASVSLPGSDVSFATKVVDGQAKLGHDGEGAEHPSVSSRTGEVRAFLLELQPALFGGVKLVALAGEQGAGLGGLGGVALIERGIGQSGFQRR